MQSNKIDDRSYGGSGFMDELFKCGMHVDPSIVDGEEKMPISNFSFSPRKQTDYVERTNFNFGETSRSYF